MGYLMSVKLYLTKHLLNLKRLQIIWIEKWIKREACSKNRNKKSEFRWKGDSFTHSSEFEI